jgi:D-alanyl-D-alanine carboxypeptidase (penicillin-binding protein 5/6)
LKLFPIRFAVIAAALAFASASHARDTQPKPPTADDVPIAILVDGTSGQVLHERNADRRFMPASITKTMTAFVAFELMEEGKLDPRQVFTVRPETFAAWRRKGSTMFLARDARVTVDDLLTGIMNVSANDGAVVLAEGAVGSVDEWVKQMNSKAREIGMTNSHFGTPNGWMDDGHTFVSARDLVKLAIAMQTRHPQKYARYIGHTGFTYGGISQPNHDPLVGRVRGAEGIKTGFTNEAGMGYLGSVRRNGRRLVLVVAGADRASVRNRAARDYVEWGYSSFDARLLFPEGAIVGKARIQGGNARAVDLKARGPIHVSVPAGTDPEYSMQIRYYGPLRAPIAGNQPVAELELKVAGMPTSQIPLMAAEPVEKAGFFARLWNGLLGWVT